MIKSVAFKNGKIYNNSANVFEQRDLQIKYSMIHEPAASSQKNDTTGYDIKNIYVMPPIVDFHCHLYHGGSNLAFDPEWLPSTGVLYACDGGTAGLSTIVGLKNYANRLKDKLRVYYWLNFASTGLHDNFRELGHQSSPNFDSFPEIYEMIKDNLIGIALRINHWATQDSVDVDYALHTALELTEELKLPLMVNIARPCYSLDLVLKMMRPKDVVSEIYHNQGEGILDNSGKVRKSFLEARERNVYFDLAHGSHNFSFDVAAKCIQQGFLPDFISTNLTRFGYQMPPIYSMMNLMSKFLALGVPLDEIVKRITTTPANYLNIDDYPYDLGGGKSASFVGFQIIKGKWRFTDSEQQKITGDALIEPAFVVGKGTLIFRQERVFF
jgi:dihydroorotase